MVHLGVANTATELSNLVVDEKAERPVERFISSAQDGIKARRKEMSTHAGFAPDPAVIQNMSSVEYRPTYLFIFSYNWVIFPFFKLALVAGVNLMLFKYNVESFYFEWLVNIVDN